MRVETCVSAVPLVQSTVAGREYSPQEAELVKMSAANLYIIHAKVLAEMDLIEWYSRGGIRRYAGRRVPIESKPRDYMVVYDGGCEQLATGKAQIFDINPEKPCRDIVQQTHETHGPEAR